MTPAYSPTRKAMLWTPEELATELNMPIRTLRRRINEARDRGTLYEERLKREGGRGAPGLYIDLLTLGLALPAQLGTQFPAPQSGTQFGNSVPQLSANPPRPPPRRRKPHLRPCPRR